jgi:hypothetical protein
LITSLRIARWPAALWKRVNLDQSDRIAYRNCQDIADHNRLACAGDPLSISAQMARAKQFCRKAAGAGKAQIA